MSNPTVLEIVKEYLKKNNFDGLYNDELCCACPFRNLNPCGDLRNDCRAGFEVKASEIPFSDEYNLYICEKKEEKK